METSGDYRVKPLIEHCDCSCSGINHALQLMYFAPLEGKEPTAALYLSMNMPFPRPWWQRIWMAVKYIFMNTDCAYLGFEHVYTPEGARRQMEILKLYLESQAPQQ